MGAVRPGRRMAPSSSSSGGSTPMKMPAPVGLAGISSSLRRTEVIPACWLQRQTGSPSRRTRSGRGTDGSSTSEDEEPSRTYVVRAVERGRVRASEPARAAVPAPDGDTEAIRVDRGIAVRNRSTGSVRLVVRACRPPSHAPALGRPAWSPDGRWLAYVDCSHSDRNGFGSEIAIVRVDGSPWRIIVAHGRGLTAPSWREGIDNP